MRLRRRVRPVLLLLVFSGFLLIVGTTASGQALFVSEDTKQALLESAAGSDTATVRSFVGLNLTPADLAPGGPVGDRRELLRKGLALMVDRGGILHAALIAPDGTVLVTDDGVGEGTTAPTTGDLTTSLTTAKVVPALVSSDVAGAVSHLDSTTILREYVPIMAGGQVYAIAAIWRDANPILAHLDEARLHVVASTLVAGFVSVIVLFFVFRAAQQRLSRQARALVQAAGRDALTGTLNHGSLVESLAARIDLTRREGDSTGVALIDLDNFGMLNDTHGHGAGDRALTEVADILRHELPPGCTWGRYGPDEFLVISAAGGAADLEPAMERLRTNLADLSLQFESSERLPVTVSVGICFHPDQRRVGDDPPVGRRGHPRRRPDERRRHDPRRGGDRPTRPPMPRPSTSSRAWSSRSTRRTATPAATPRTWPATRTSSPSGSTSTPRCGAPCTPQASSTTSARSASRTRSCASPDR